jgi:16S rRNA C967 or C1407 C5-methylase (RsmB/RsmF family)
MDEPLSLLPSDFCDRLQQFLPREMHDRILATFSLPRRAALRINPLRGEPTQIMESLLAAGIELTPVTWSPVSFAVPNSQREIVSRLPTSDRGEVYLQSLSSQLAAVILAPQPGDHVLDLAAAPGGKAAHLAALMQNHGLLSCVEPIRPRFFRLQANLKTTRGRHRTLLYDRWTHRRK